MTYAEVIPTIIAALPSIAIAFWSIWQTRKMHDEDMVRQQNKAREDLERQEDNARKEQEKREKKALSEENKRKLEAFYYPYMLIAKENTSLYKVFSQEHLAKDENYRTLTSLLSGKVFSENDCALLEQIIENDCRLRDLINTHANVVDDDFIRNKLVESATHYAIIELAFKKKIIGEVERFEPYVHPNEVYGLVERKARELEKEMQDALRY